MKSQTDWWNLISNDEKADIDDGLRQADNGELTPHEEVMAKYNRWRAQVDKNLLKKS